jgi:5-methylcytosine-specific restriction endonuclease McrA
VDFDHIVPISRGGADTDDNLQVAHVRCNRTRNAHSADLLEYMSDERAAAAA